MQPINEILKEIQLPTWICWGLSIFASAAGIMSAIQTGGGEPKKICAEMPVAGLICQFLVMGMIFYFANDAVGRKKERAQELSKLKAETAAIQAARNEKIMGKTLDLDCRLQSLEGIIGYLDQSLKMSHEPKQLTAIVLFLAKRIQQMNSAGRG